MKRTLLLSRLFGLPLVARDIQVGHDADASSIAAAIKLARAGDTIHLEPKVHRDYAGFYGKQDEPGKPVTIDGGSPSSVQCSDGQVVAEYYASSLDGQPAESMNGYHMAAIVWDPARTFAAHP